MCINVIDQRRAWISLLIRFSAESEKFAQTRIAYPRVFRRCRAETDSQLHLLAVYAFV